MLDIYMLDIYMYMVIKHCIYIISQLKSEMG